MGDKTPKRPPKPKKPKTPTALTATYQPGAIAPRRSVSRTFSR